MKSALERLREFDEYWATIEADRENHTRAVDALSKSLLPTFDRFDKNPELKARLIEESDWIRGANESAKFKSFAGFAAADAQSALNSKLVNKLAELMQSIEDERSLAAALPTLREIDEQRKVYTATLNS